MKNFIDYFNYIEDNVTRMETKIVADKIKLVYDKNTFESTAFLNSNVIRYCEPILKEYNVQYKLFPSNINSERKSLILFPEYIDKKYINVEDYFISLRITNKSKFKTLYHSDYLGVLMSLGIDRRKLGDIYVHSNYADIICDKDLKNIILYNIDKIGNNKIEVDELMLKDICYKEPECVEKIINVTSLRLDNIVKNLVNKSRDMANDLINSGDVKVNFEVVSKKTKILNKDDVISIRKFGRYKIDDLIGSTRSGKFKLNVKCYINKNK